MYLDGIGVLFAGGRGVNALEQVIANQSVPSSLLDVSLFRFRMIRFRSIKFQRRRWMVG